MVIDVGIVAEDEIEDASQHAFPGQRNTEEDVWETRIRPPPVTANTRTATSESGATAAAVQIKTKLNELFARREEEHKYFYPYRSRWILTKLVASFTLLSLLDLDLEPQDDVLGASSVSAITLPSTHVTMSRSSSKPPSSLNSNHQVQVKKLGHEGDKGITPDSLSAPLSRVESSPCYTRLELDTETDAYAWEKCYWVYRLSTFPRQCWHSTGPE
ncbi:hypothetical protein EDC04DRAFT_2907085 [Pisolithus marmoratus]|nr:hypothetical protein EDC04DRAFT_2907085 [Pisolithus marmoratus]